jgi:magnesium chelatase subunit D
MTDGRANVPLHDGSDPWQDVLDQSAAIARLGVPSLVLDTESGQVRLGMSEQLATALKAEFMPVEKLSAGELKKVIRAAARRGSGA